LPNDGGRRRVPGAAARRGVALLAGISIEYYTRIERGSVRGVSGDVLGARKALDQLANWTTAPNDATAITSGQRG
jgi:hypothetical protein